MSIHTLFVIGKIMLWGLVGPVLMLAVYYLIKRLVDRGDTTQQATTPSGTSGTTSAPGQTRTNPASPPKKTGRLKTLLHVIEVLVMIGFALVVSERIHIAIKNQHPKNHWRFHYWFPPGVPNKFPNKNDMTLDGKLIRNDEFVFEFGAYEWNNTSIEKGRYVYDKLKGQGIWYTDRTLRGNFTLNKLETGQDGQDPNSPTHFTGSINDKSDGSLTDMVPWELTRE
jgi:hypothetical protein